MLYCSGSRDGVFDTAARRMGRCSVTDGGGRFYLLFEECRPGLGPTQAPVQLIIGAFLVIKSALA